MLALTALSCYRPEPGTDLRAELKQRLGQAPRRLSPFIQLALVGALDALRDRAPADWRLAIGTARGAMDELKELMEMHERGEMPMPLTFINSQVHIIGHYLAQLTGCIESVEVGDCDQGGEDMQLWLSQHASSDHTLWGWVDVESPWEPARSDWLCLEREPRTAPLGWLTCEWRPLGSAMNERTTSLPQWLNTCLQDTSRTMFTCERGASDGGSWLTTLRVERRE